MKISTLYLLIKSGLKGIKSQYFSTRLDKWGYRGERSIVITPFHGIKENTYLHENTYIGEGANLHNYRAKFIMKRNSNASFGLVVTGGKHVFDDIDALPEGKGWNKTETLRPTVVEEGCWLAGNVILGEGVTIGRGCVVGAGSVVRHKTPPYSIVMGNPAKVVGFRFTPEEMIEYEKKHFKPEERFPEEIFHKNYKKYFLDRLKEIKDYTRL